MRKLVLSVLALAATLAAQAQISGVAITPAGAKATDQITIIVTPDQTCTAGGPGIVGQPILRMHAGVQIAGSKWTNVIEAGKPDAAVNEIIGFTQQANGTWTKTIVPQDYFQLFPTDVVEAMQFVLNAGADATPWSNEGKNTENPDASGKCDYWDVAFPVSGRIVSNKKSISNVISAATVSPNPSTGTASVSFNLKHTENVVVTVKNLLGQNVSTLSNGIRTAGAQRLTWTSNDEPSGLYFVTIEAAGSVQTLKVQLDR